MLQWKGSWAASTILLYYGKVGGIDASEPLYGHLHMVVMDYVDSTTVYNAQKQNSLPEDFHEQVEAILSHLYGQGYVFGDLHSPNIMVMKSKKVMFIDFDWVGKDKESRYPIKMAQSITWPDSVRNGLGVMKQKHNKYMLDQLCSKKF